MLDQKPYIQNWLTQVFEEPTYFLPWHLKMKLTELGT